MVRPTQRRATHYSAPIFLSAVLMLCSPLTAHADTPAQRQELAAALRQLDALERFIAQSASRTSTIPGERYHSDSPRLLDDLARVRTGIQSVAVNEVDTLIRFYAAVFSPVSGFSGFNITTSTRSH
ncbi:RAQPRD family integrative conjugative element protein [Pectobacterium odoriferum]|uniref:RAQPRD family integrative conjugative element protein n=1 Tax=Pectobacterium odoriferum TaxID=78398 RepID=UPI0032ECC1FA